MFDYSKKRAEETNNLEANTFQWNQVDMARSHNDKGDFATMTELCNKLNIANQIRGINDQRVPADLYRAFDTTVTRKFEPQGKFAVLNALIPRSRSVMLEETKFEFARSSDAGRAQTSMSGQVGAALDAVQYTYDGTMVPIHDTGFKINFRDSRLQKVGAFDMIADNQYESVDTIKLKYVDYLFNGFKDDAGNFVTYDGVQWKGFRGDDRVELVDLGAGGLNIDFTSGAVTAANIRNAWITLRDRLAITNNCTEDAVYYVSREIASSFERYFSDSDIQFGTIKDALEKLELVSSIQVDPELTGNQVLAFPVSGDKVAPVVGSAIATVADPRMYYNSDYVWRTWGAMGIMVKNDFAGRTCVMYASS